MFLQAAECFRLNRKRLALVFLVLGLSLGLEAFAASQGPEHLRYAGATTLQRDFMPKAAWAFEARTGVTFGILGGNTDPGLQSLLAGKVDIAGAGRFLTDREKVAGLVETLVGWDPLAVVVHQSNPVENLGLKALQGIFSGRLASWKEVGGFDQPILVVTSPEGSGMRATVQEEILQGEAFSPHHLTSVLVEGVDLQVAHFPIAVCAVSRSMVDAPGIKILRINGLELNEENVRNGSYPLLKPLLLVTRGEPRGAADDFIRFALSSEGQAIMARKFFRAETLHEASSQP